MLCSAVYGVTLQDVQGGTGFVLPPFKYDKVNYDFAFETFNASQTYNFIQVEAWIKEEGTPLGDVSASIYNVNSSNQPTTILGIANNTISGLTITTSYLPYNFTFTNSVPLTINTRYAIVLNASGIADTINFFRFESSSSGNNTIGYNGTSSNGWSSADTTATGHFNTFGSTVAPANLTVISVYPANNTQFNTNNLTLNITTESNRLVNISLYVNGVLNQTQTNRPIGTNVLTSFNLTFTTSAPAKYFYHFVTTNDETQANSSNNTFYVDTVLPSLTSSTFQNGSIFFSNTNQNFTTQLNISDTFLLFSYNISFDGVPYIGKSDLNTQNYSINVSKNITTFRPGSHTLNLRYADGHTAEKIDPYTVDDGFFNNKLIFDTPNQKQISITPTDSSIFDSMTSKKEFDRYTFDYAPSKKDLSEYSFYVDSNDDIHILNTDSKYKNYIITGEHWLDFVLEEQPQSTVRIELVNNNRALVTVGNLNAAENFKFSSIGDLNVVYQNFTFGIVNATATYTDPVSETQTHNTNILFNISGTGLTDANFTLGFFLYNHTAINTTKVSDGLTYVQYLSSPVSPQLANGVLSQQILFNWSVNVSSLGIFNLSYFHTVNAVQFQDCALNTSWFPALNLSSLNEEYNHSVYVPNTTINAHFEVWVESEAAYKNFSVGFAGSNNYSLCIYPNSSSYRINSIMEYFAPTMANRKYYLRDYVLDNTTDQIYLYNINSSKASDVVINVVNLNTGQNVQDAYIQLQRYYPETNAYKTVEIEKTDENGLALGKLVLADVFYKPIVVYNGVVVLSGNVQRILSTTWNLPISLNDDYMESFNKIGHVTNSVTCTNSTLICRFEWSDDQNIVQTAVLKVYRTNSLGRTLLSTQSLSSTSGTLLYHINETTTGNTYVAEGYLHTNTAHSDYRIGSFELAFPNVDIKSRFGLSAIFGALLLILSISLVFADIGTPGIVGGAVVGLIFLTISGIISIPMGVLMSLIIVAGIIIYKVRR